jgi:hypothetical protein
MPVAFGSILVSPFLRIQKKVNKGIRDADESNLKILYKLRGIWEDELMPRGGPTWKNVSKCIVRISIRVLETGVALCWFIVQLLTLPIEVFQPINTLVLGFAWTIYDIITIKLSNWSSVVDALDTPSAAERSNPEGVLGLVKYSPLLCSCKWSWLSLTQYSVSGSILASNSVSSKEHS